MITIALATATKGENPLLSKISAIRDRLLNYSASLISLSLIDSLLEIAAILDILGCYLSATLEQHYL
ncbi:MAG: hypothetical protein F6J98_15560 [Moorea sp. SIO4G2]|nr:hypothetical protein [Moorena sp. SIO4G2]